MTRKRQISLTLDQAILELVDRRGTNRSETIARDLWDYYTLLFDATELMQDEEETLP